MTYTQMNGLRYDSAGSSQPVYPPHLVASAGCPAGPRPFPPAEPGYPAMLPGFPEAWPDRAAPQPIAASTVYRPPVTVAQAPAYYYAPAAPAAHPRYPATPAFLGVHEAAYAAYLRDRAAAPGPSPDGDTQVRPPRVLIVGVATGLTAVGATVISQLLALSDGREAIKAAVEGKLPGAAGPFSRLIAAAVNSAYHTIQVRAAFSIGLAVVAAVLLAFALWAGLVTRLAAVGAMALSGLVLMVCVRDVYPADARLAGMIALVLYPVAAGLLFMPAVGRYRDACSASAPASGIGALQERGQRA